MNKTTQTRWTARLLALVLAFALTAPAMAAETASTTLEETAQTAAEAAMTYGSASRISWAVWQDGEILSGGTKFDEAHFPDSHLLQLATIFNNVYGIGSVSKIYTTVAVMQLAEAGKIDLDKPVTTYLPDFKMADERYKGITVRMLLNHSSGLMGSSMGSGLLFDDPSTQAADELLDRLASQRLKADPGAYSVYCNDGFTLAELVVEAVSGQDYMEYIRANILQPAGLDHTSAPSEDMDKVRVAPIYNGDDTNSLPMDCLGVVGTGGLYATAEDVAAFGGALTGETLLKQASLDAMAAPEYAKGVWPEGVDALAFGLGWDNVEWYPFSQSGVTALVKGGDTQYYHAGLVVIPEYHLSAAVLTSGGVSTYNELAASAMLLAVLEEQGVEIDQTPITLPDAKPASMPKEYMDYAGYYASLYVYEISIARSGKLTMHYQNLGMPDQTFTYYSDGSFRDETGTASLRFVKEDNGQIYLHQQAFTLLPGLSGLPTSNYAAVKLPENKIDGGLQAYWNDLNVSVDMLPVNERYSSQVYLALTAAAAMAEAQAEQSGGQEEYVPGYIGNLQIVDENEAVYVTQIPGSVGRDGNDMTVSRDENGLLWLRQSNGMVYMESKGAPELSVGNGQSRCTIQPNGYARWYRSGSAAGKTMTVEVPADASFWVYDGSFQLTASSVVGKDTKAVLPEDGYIVFAGDPGARFTLSFQ